MTADEAISIVNSKAQGRTNYEGKPTPLDEVLVAEIERLRAIVEKLPKTADGVPIVPGMTVWGSSCGTAPYPYLIDNVTIDRGKSIEDDDGAWGLDAVIGRHETAVYSTEAAADAGSEVKK